MEIETLAVRAAIAAIFSGPTFCLSVHCRWEGGIDGVLPVIGSKSKSIRCPPITFKALYLKVTAATVDTQEKISSLFIQVFTVFFSFFVTSVHAPLFSLHTDPAVLLFVSLRLSRCLTCPSNLATNPEDVVYFIILESLKIKA